MRSGLGIRPDDWIGLVAPRYPARPSHDGKDENVGIDPQLESMVVTFEIADMTCGHCVASVTQAVRSVDDAATVLAELATHRVRIASEVASIERLRAAIEDAGYTPVAVDDVTLR